MLIDRQIHAAMASGDLVVQPADGIDARVQPASLDVRLGYTFAVFRRAQTDCLDLKRDTSTLLDFVEVPEGGHFMAHPGELILASTLESVGLSTSMLARVEGKSSLGRVGLLVHSTAGFIDPGWPLAPITLELANVNSLPIKVYPGMPIAQIALERVEEVAQAYSGKYVAQSGPAPSRFHLNWTGSRWI